MNFSFHAFEDDDAFHLLPGVAVRVGRCEDPCCGRVHAYALELTWLMWGVAVALNFQPFDPS